MYCYIATNTDLCNSEEMIIDSSLFLLYILQDTQQMAVYQFQLTAY